MRTAGTLTTLMEAAGQLGVGVFGSGPLQEAALLQQSALQVPVCYSNLADVSMPPHALCCMTHHSLNNHALAPVLQEILFELQAQLQKTAQCVQVLCAFS